MGGKKGGGGVGGCLFLLLADVIRMNRSRLRRGVFIFFWEWGTCMDMVDVLGVLAPPAASALFVCKPPFYSPLPPPKAPFLY